MYGMHLAQCLSHFNDLINASFLSLLLCLPSSLPFNFSLDIFLSCFLPLFVFLIYLLCIPYLTTDYSVTATGLDQEAQ